MSLKGFDPVYRDFPDYILGITERIWEGRDLDYIRATYAPDCVVHTPMGSFHGVEPVVRNTVESLHQFPDRLLLGEDVIWSGSPETALLSSHRVFSTQTHRGWGPFGAPTGRPVMTRAIADCAAKDNFIYEEWLLRDGAAVAKQLGLDPAELGRRWAAEDEAAGRPAPAMAFDRCSSGPDTRDIQDDLAARLVRETMEAIWLRRDLSVVRRAYDRACNWNLPGWLDVFGWDAYDGFLLGYLASFPDATLTFDHSVARRDPERPVRVATRWLLTTKHAGAGVFGEPSQTPLFILGVTHSEVSNGRILREWMMVDELAIWRRIGRKLG